jgi:hypothetical protein
VEGYQRVTPARIISSLAAFVDDLKLPHPLHLHCNNLGIPGNVATTIETMNVIEGHRAHLAHLQFHAYGGDDWSSMRSESARLAEAFNAHGNLTTDAGAVLFGDAVTITADGPWQHLLYQLTGRKVGKSRRRERNRMRHRSLRLQGSEPGQRRAVGGGTRAPAPDRGSVARVLDHGSSQRRLLLAVP